MATLDQTYSPTSGGSGGIGLDSIGLDFPTKDLQATNRFELLLGELFLFQHLCCETLL